MALANPSPSLTTNGTLYGTTSGIAGHVAGTVFSFSMGLGPFVRTVPTSGSVGRNVRILGTDLTGSTSVTFNGTRAVFTVVSATEINATVSYRRDHRHN